MDYGEERVLFIWEAWLATETYLGACGGRMNSLLRDNPEGLCWGHPLPLLRHVKDHPMSGSFMDLDTFSKLGSSNVDLASIVVVKHGSKFFWHSSYQGVGSMSLPVDSRQVVDPWSMAEGLEKAMCLLFIPLTMLAFWRRISWKAPSLHFVRNPTHMERPCVGALACPSAIPAQVPTWKPQAS